MTKVKNESVSNLKRESHPFGSGEDQVYESCFRKVPPDLHFPRHYLDVHSIVSCDSLPLFHT